MLNPQLLKYVEELLITLRKRFRVVYDRWSNQMGLKLIDLLADEDAEAEKKIMIISEPHSFVDEQGVEQFIEDLTK